MDTSLTPAEMAADLINTFALSPDAPLKIAESHRLESIDRKRHADAEYWSQVCDLLADRQPRELSERAQQILAETPRDEDGRWTA